MKIRRRRKKNGNPEELDITSLLDILVILLVFLLKSFNDSDLSVELANELALPYSMSRISGETATMIQINKKKNIFINNKIMGHLESQKTFRDVQVRLEEEFRRISKILSEKEKKSSRKLMINFLFDETVVYRDIRRIMDISSDSGFKKYKLIVQGDD